jgi:hypothetical protein
LEATMMSLAEEVEFLSAKNERLLNDLKKKDFFEVYNQQIE